MAAPDTKQTLLEAHRLSSGAGSHIAHALATKQVTGRVIQQAILNLNMAAEHLESLLPGNARTGEGE